MDTMRRLLRTVGAASLLSLGAAAGATAADDGFRPLFNGKDLSGWEGNPELWTVKDGCIMGATTGPEQLAYNQFLVWSGGSVKNFELRAKVRVEGNNSGIQYRSKELKDVGPWSVGGYQADIHPSAPYNAMLYEERGRGIVSQNGQSVIVDEQGQKWVTATREPVKVDVAQWNEYTVIAMGNRLTHKLNGQVTMELIDHEVAKRSFDGVVAFQVHRGPAMKVAIKDILLKELPDGGVLSPADAPVPAGAKKVEPPKPKGKK